MSPLHFHPPQELKDELGPFRSPLLFDNGTRASNALEWSKRRQEILDYWHNVMGQWPALLMKPQFSVLEQEREKGFSRLRLSMSLALGQLQQGWLLVPDGAGPFPAVLVVYYDPDTGAGLKPVEGAHRDYGLQLVKEGFVALCIGTPAGDAWKPDTGEAICQPLSFYAYVAANAWILLASLPQVDAQRIGIAGHSYGGKWALFAGALWGKFAAISISDPGIVWDETRANVNYWEPWYLGYDPALTQQRQPGIPTEQNPRTGAYKRLIDEGHDLTDLHALICPRPFLVSGGSEDLVERWMALNHARAVNEVLQIKEPRIAMTNRQGHTPDEFSNAVLRSFFRHFLSNA